jgi:hypothetical protein
MTCVITEKLENKIVSGSIGPQGGRNSCSFSLSSCHFLAPSNPIGQKTSFFPNATEF